MDPKIDYVFKRIFGEKGDEDILMSLMNSILKGNPTINELELLNTEYPKEGFIRKSCHFDILAKTDNGISINIEECNIDVFSIYNIIVSLLNIKV